MARSQTWTRNIPKKKKGAVLPSRAIVDGGALEGLKRRAEDLGLILHARTRVEKRRAVSDKKRAGGK